MSIRCAGNRPKAGRATLRPAATSGNPAICRKPRIKCGDCDQRLLLPVTDQVIYDHLAGKQTIGVYPLLADDTCYFLAADFDEADWREDAQAFMQICRELDIPAALEISRSGQGAHVWMFFAEPVSAREARQLGAALISHTCARTRQLALPATTDFFPNQDTLPKGGFGNLIALPLQKTAARTGAQRVRRREFRSLSGPVGLSRRQSSRCPASSWKAPFCGPAVGGIPWMSPL